MMASNILCQLKYQYIKANTHPLQDYIRSKLKSRANFDNICANTFAIYFISNQTFHCKKVFKGRMLQIRKKVSTFMLLTSSSHSDFSETENMSPLSPCQSITIQSSLQQKIFEGRENYKKILESG